MTGLTSLKIVNTGMITPIGANTAMTEAAIRAGISGQRIAALYETPLSRINMAIVPTEALPYLKVDLLRNLSVNARQARLLRLADAALDDDHLKINLKELTVPPPLFLAGPEPLPGEVLPMRSAFIKNLQTQTGFAFDLELSKVFPMGRAASFYALQSAFETLEHSEHDFVLLGGVDSYWHQMTLAQLARQERLNSEKNSMDAFVASEAAAFLLLTKNESFQNARKIYRPGISEESGHRYSDDPYLGDGLAQAFRTAIYNAQGANIQSVYSSHNGESFSSKEFGVAMIRSNDDLGEHCTHEHPVDCLGDVGAAIGPILLALSSIQNRNATLCYGASDDEFRGAACVV
ncbi:MAG: beta-ketoacyl synthase N-terminal-like domain-containing protein [Pseudomonadota bacterium]